MSTEAQLQVVNTIKSRTTIGRLAAPAPGAEDLKLILEAAARAPDHGKLKPWRFFVIRDAGLAKLGDLMVEAQRRRDPASDATTLERERQKPLRAPMILVVAAHIADHPRIPAVEQLLAAGAAVQNALLAAHALGYGAAWKTGDICYDDFVKAAFGLRPADALVGFLYLGTPVQAQSFAGEIPVAAPEWTGSLA